MCDVAASKVLVEIIRILKEEKKLRKHHLELLVGPQLRCLDLSRSYDDVSHSVQLAVIRCPVSSARKSCVNNTYQ